MGVRVKAANRLNSVTVATVRPKGRRSCPNTPPDRPRGTNTTTSTRVMATAARPISLRPFRAASAGGSPRSRWRWMFSRTTMESSTRIPMARERPSMVKKFRVNPKDPITTKEESSEVGMARKTMSVFTASCRKKNTMADASTTPSTRARNTSFTASRAKVEASLATVTSRSGSSARRRASSRFTASATAMVLASAALRTRTVTLSSPFKRLSCDRSATPSCTAATSRSRTAPPPGKGRSTSRTCSRSANSPRARTPYCRGPRRREPAGTLRFSWARAAVTAPRLSP
ncbi:hypothetical protein HRbin32_01672 [bacterium HR32]|nr:hypothetical protein HRbin32_01672 [bacterium HR32]